MSKLLERKYLHWKICVFRTEQNGNIYIGQETKREEGSSLFRYTFLLYPHKNGPLEILFAKGPETIESHMFIGTVRMPTPKVAYYFNLTKAARWLETYELTKNSISNGWDVFYNELKKPIDEERIKDYQQIFEKRETEEW